MKRVKQYHGRYRTPTWYSWNSMFVRCYNPEAKGYENYGGRGICVCERWSQFLLFVEDMGERPFGTSLDRVNNELGYSKGNCRWSTRKQQSNNRRDNTVLDHNGLSLTISGWCEKTGLSRDALQGRLRKGWPVGMALDTPKVRERRAAGRAA